MDSIEPRPITDEERGWLERGLSSLKTGEYRGGGWWVETATGRDKPLDERVDPAFWLAQLDRLTVVGQCTCGEPNCHTVRFKRAGTGRVVALAIFYTPDHRTLIVHIDEKSGELAELEVI